MKVVLISLPFSIDSDRSTSQEIRFFPEGLASVAASLIAAGHEVEVLDLSIQPGDQLEQHSDAEIFGISAMINQFQSLENLILRLRRINSRAKIILGGPLISSDPLFVGQYLDFDFAVIGEGELTIVELLKNFEKAELLRGVAIKKNGKLILTSLKQDTISLKELPSSTFNLFRLPLYLKGERRLHFESIIGKRLYLNNFMVTRGCPFNCRFCYRLFGREIRYKSESQIRAELEMWHKAGAEFVRFQDDNFTLLPQERLTPLLELLEKFKFKWSAHSRVDTVDREKLQYMKEFGLEIIYYGIESLSLEALKRSRKDAGVERIIETIELTLGIGIKPAVFFIVGLPGETENSLRNMVELVRCYKLAVTPYLFCPLPGTELFSYAIREGKIENELEFLRQCQEWEENQVKEGKLYINLTHLPDNLLLDTYLDLFTYGSN